MKNKRKISLALVLILVLTLAMSTASFAAVKINHKKITIGTYAPTQLTITGTKKKVTWKSSNPKVLKVTQKGVITGKKAGKATVTATVGKKKYKCVVTVLNMKMISNRLKAKAAAKYEYVHGGWYQKKGNSLYVDIGRSFGEGAVVITYKVNLRTGYAQATEKYTWREFYKKIPFRFKLF